MIAALVSFGLSGCAMADTKEPRKWKTITYKVKPGDTLTSIAQKYDTSPEKLMKWNRGLQPTNLQIGQPLKIAIINPDWKEWKTSGGKKRNKSKAQVKKSTKKSSSKKVASKKKVDTDKAEKSNKDTEKPKVAKADKAEEKPEAKKVVAEKSPEPPKKIDDGDSADSSAQPPKMLANNLENEDRADHADHDHDHDHGADGDDEGDITDGVDGGEEVADNSDEQDGIEPGFDDTPDFIPTPKVADKPRGPLPRSFNYKGEKLPVVTGPDMIGSDIKRAVYFVGNDENIGSVALKFGLDPEDLLYWNDLDRIKLHPEEVLVFKLDAKPRVPKKPLPTVHRVKRGDTYERIAKKYGVSVKQLKRWNPKINPRKLQIGQTIRMYIPGRNGRSVSYGTANRGKLYNGVALESTDGLKVRTVSNAYGTERVIRLLKGAAFDVQARWPDAPNLVVGDISYRRGGRIKKHKSHQSGRDADVSFFYRGNVQTRDFVDMEHETFDAVKNWHVFKTLIDTGEVEYIFIDYPLQKVLYEYAMAIGYTEEELEPLLQYPRPKSMGVGIIRHVRGHDDHWHIRFKCGPEDRGCR